MRYIKSDDIKPGMRLAYNIYDTDGHTLICSGSVISDFYIKKLKNTVLMVYILRTNYPKILKSNQLFPIICGQKVCIVYEIVTLINAKAFPNKLFEKY